MAQGMRTGMAVATALIASMALASSAEARLLKIDTQQPFLFNWVEAPSNTGGTLSASADVMVDIAHHKNSTGWVPAFLTYDGVIPDGNPAAPNPFGAWDYVEHGMFAQMTLTYTGATPLSFQGFTVSPGQVLIMTSPPSSWNADMDFLDAPAVKRVTIYWNSNLAYTSLYSNTTPQLFGRIFGIPNTLPSTIPDQALGSFSFMAAARMELSGGAAPEPSSWVMLLTGVFGVGTAMRRRARMTMQA
jgi:hypothetical protein